MVRVVRRCTAASRPRDGGAGRERSRAQRGDGQPDRLRELLPAGHHRRRGVDARQQERERLSRAPRRGRLRDRRPHRATCLHPGAPAVRGGTRKHPVGRVDPRQRGGAPSPAPARRPDPLAGRHGGRPPQSRRRSPHLGPGLRGRALRRRRGGGRHRRRRGSGQAPRDHAEDRDRGVDRIPARHRLRVAGGGDARGRRPVLRRHRACGGSRRRRAS